MASGKRNKWTILGFLSFVMTVVLIVTSFSIFYSLMVMVFLPTPSEYEGVFPTEPPLFSNEFWGNFTSGVIRHVALLNDHINTQSLIRIIGLSFTTLIIYSIRKKVLEMKKAEEKNKIGTIEIDEYVKWGFGSIISAIMLTASQISLVPERANIILVLCISAFILYLIYPRLGLMAAIKRRIYDKKPATSKNQS